MRPYLKGNWSLKKLWCCMKQKITFRNVFILGLVVCLATTAYDVAFDKQWNFFIFKLATLDFWNGVVPYGEHWFRHGYDYYLYSPIFNVLFTPFAYLPKPLGEFAWNLSNYVLLAYAIHSFPRITAQQKSYTLLFLLPILGPALMSCQYNIMVAAMFVLAFSLLERNKPGWAILLMLVSGMTKIYGLSELSILVFYPRLWRNLGVALLWGVVLAALPLLRLSWAEYVDFAQRWVGVFAEHKASRRWETLFDMQFIPMSAMRYTLMPYIQVGFFFVLSALVLAKRALWTQFSFRIGVVGLIMGWCILFGNSSETHTYLISVVGFLLWYHNLSDRPKTLRVLYWAVLVVIALLPIDLLVPMSVWEFCYRVLDLNKWLMLFVWIYMSVLIFDRKRYVGLSV